jgi:hypothetical protein
MMYKLLAIFFLLATLYSKPLLLVLTSAIIVYVVWFSGEDVTGATPAKFLEADHELSLALSNLKESLRGYPYDYDIIREKVDEFVSEYMLCFTDVNEARANFERLADLRRDILGHASLLLADRPVPVATFEALSRALWKYLHILIRKWDLEYSYPVPSNTYRSSKELYG